MPAFGDFLTALVGYLFLVGVLLVVLVRKREPAAALGWGMAVVALPVVGAVLFALFGLNALPRRLRRKRAHHVVQRLLRTTARRHARGDRPEPLATRAHRLPDEATTITRRVARDEGLAAFVRRLEELDDDDRRLLMYRGLEGLAHRDVGELLGVSEETAKKRWLRLRERLSALPSARTLWDAD